MKIQFTVAKDNITDFAEVLTENDMKNEIIGTTDEGNLLINVFCNSDSSEALESLAELSEDDE
jgi:hypothetical protein